MELGITWSELTKQIFGSELLKNFVLDVSDFRLQNMETKFSRERGQSNARAVFFQPPLGYKKKTN